MVQGGCRLEVEGVEVSYPASPPSSLPPTNGKLEGVDAELGLGGGC